MVTLEDVISELSKIPYLNQIIYVGITVLAAVILERLLSRYIKRFAEKKDLPPDVGNGLVLISRFGILLGATALLLRTGGVPTDWLTAFGAFGGTAVGFASTRTLGNFIAGLYVLVSKPFRVGDYVKVGSYEGIIEEITINYTKIKTPSSSTVSITNQKILNQDIINYRLKKQESTINIFSEAKETLYCYNFTVEFDHTFTHEQLDGILTKVVDRYADRYPKRPEYNLESLTRLSKTYRFYIYLNDPEEIYEKRTRFLKSITEAWENAKQKA